MSNQNLKNIIFLKEQYSGDIQALLNAYLNENYDCLKSIQVAFTGNDQKMLKEIAHEMKGSSNVIGTSVIEDLKIKIGKSSDMNTINGLVNELEVVLNILKKELSKLFLK